MEMPGSYMVPIPEKGAFREALVAEAVGQDHNGTGAPFHLCTEPTSSTPFPDMALGVIVQPGCGIHKSLKQGPWCDRDLEELGWEAPLQYLRGHLCESPQAMLAKNL